LAVRSLTHRPHHPSIVQVVKETPGYHMQHSVGSPAPLLGYADCLSRRLIEPVPIRVRIGFIKSSKNIFTIVLAMRSILLAIPPPIHHPNSQEIPQEVLICRGRYQKGKNTLEVEEIVIRQRGVLPAVCFDP
jgi:hypothetical protein